MSNETEERDARIGEAERLYGMVRTLTADMSKIDPARAELAVEYATDAIALYGSSHQERKVELREILRTTQEVMPPKSIGDLRTMIEAKLLRFIYPKDAVLRNIFIGIATLLVVVSIVSSLPGYFGALGQVGPSANSGATEVPKDVIDELEFTNRPEHLVFDIDPESGTVGVWVNNRSAWTIEEFGLKVTFIDRETAECVSTRSITFTLAEGSTGAPYDLSEYRAETETHLWSNNDYSYRIDSAVGVPPGGCKPTNSSEEAQNVKADE